jgi:hypothetical protein
MGRGTVEGCAGETGRGDTIVEGTLVVVAVVGVRDVDEAARCLRASGFRDVDRDETRCLRTRSAGIISEAGVQ